MQPLEEETHMIRRQLKHFCLKWLLATTAPEKRKCHNTKDVLEKMPSTELKSRPTKPNLLNNNNNNKYLYSV